MKTITQNQFNFIQANLNQVSKYVFYFYVDFNMKNCIEKAKEFSSKIKPEIFT